MERTCYLLLVTCYLLLVTSYAGVAELADALDSGSSGAIRVGSSPVTCTTKHINKPQGFVYVLFVFLKSWRGGDLNTKTLRIFVGSPTARKYCSKCARCIASLHFSLFLSGASPKTIINCFRLAYPSPAPEKV